MIEWPLGETEPAKYWLSTLPQSIAFKELVRLITSCAGASNATTRSSSKNSGWVITKGATGAVSITTPH